MLVNSAFTLALAKRLSVEWLSRNAFNLEWHNIRLVHPVFKDLFVSDAQLIGEERRGLRHVFDEMNAERILLAAESIGDGRWLCSSAATYASQRKMFGHFMGQNQAVQLPPARAYAAVSAADLMRREAAALFDSGRECAAQAKMAKLLASEAARQAANACFDAFVGYRFVREYGRRTKVLGNPLVPSRPNPPTTWPWHTSVSMSSEYPSRTEVEGRHLLCQLHKVEPNAPRRD